jgi:hypothetical protein
MFCVASRSSLSFFSTSSSASRLSTSTSVMTGPNSPGALSSTTAVTVSPSSSQSPASSSRSPRSDASAPCSRRRLSHQRKLLHPPTRPVLRPHLPPQLARSLTQRLASRLLDRPLVALHRRDVLSLLPHRLYPSAASRTLGHNCVAWPCTSARHSRSTLMIPLGPHRSLAGELLPRRYGLHRSRLPHCLDNPTRHEPP